MKARHFFRQALRGIGSLPHVGHHPGTAPVLAIILLPGLAFLPHGAWAVMGGITFGAIVFGPIYLCGSYDRAELSDRLERKRTMKSEASE